VIQVKRVYERPAKSDGARFLVDRLWPRGVKKGALQVDGWVKEVVPSDALRRWFGHKPEKWTVFQKRYFAELDQKREAWRGNVTLLFSARDAERNNAVALRDYLMAKLKKE